MVSVEITRYRYPIPIPQILPDTTDTRYRYRYFGPSLASIGHLHAESLILPVKPHLSLLCSQFLARAHQPSHPSFPIVTAPSGIRSIRSTLQSRFLPSVSPFLTDGVMLPEDYKPTLSALHTSAVQQALADAPLNRVLSVQPPPIDPSETSLPRPHRTLLSQLRSGLCSSLLSYRERIGLADSPNCPSCHSAPHTTSHVFSCPSHPTPLSVLDLWHRPGPASEFLSTLPFFNVPPVPRPPPEPPPTP